MLSAVRIAMQYAHRATSYVAGGTVVYRRGPQSIAVHEALPREPQYEVDGNAEVTLSHLDRDWSVPADSLIFNGKLTEPQRGDLIEWNGETYEVLPYGKTECFRPVGSPPVTFRVHSKKIK